MAGWLARNYAVFGEPVFIRSNFGEELRLGNGPGSLGAWMGWLHPVQSAWELQRYREKGEVAYVAERRRQAFDFIEQQPGLFAANTLRRFFWFWGGTTKGEVGDALPVLRGFALTSVSLLTLLGLLLMFRSGRREGVLFAGLLSLFPLVYYITFVIPRYRHPIEPEMLLLICYFLCEYGREREPGRVSSGHGQAGSGGR
jgi:hypothetical protein